MTSFSNGNDTHHVSFNQDYTCVSIASREGFSIFNLDPVELRYKHSGGEGVGHIEMLHCTSLIALVGSGDQPGSSPRKFKLWNSKNKETICEISFPSSVLNVKLNRDRLVICLELQIHVYELATMKCLQILSTTPNPSGLMALSGEASSYLVFPSGAAGAGSVVLYDCVSLRLLSQIDAHKKTLMAMQFNREGTMLVTASVTGTVLRVFAVPSGEHLCSFRRGTRSAQITSLCFSQRSSVLAVGSSSGTVHIFDVGAGLRKRQEASGSASVGGAGGKVTEREDESEAGGGDKEGSWRESLTSSARSYFSMAQSWSKAAVGGLNLLPQPMQEFAESMWAIAHARVPLSVAGGHFQVALLTVTPTADDPQVDEDLKIVVVTQNKHLFRYNVPKNVSELSAQQMSGEEAVVLCALDDEALLEY